MTAKEIVKYARDLRAYYGSDPFLIAQRFDIKVNYRPMWKDLKGYTLKFKGHPTLIALNEAFSPFAQRIIMAHELGHSLLHAGRAVYHYNNMSNKHINTSTEEYEANLFAVALLFGNDSQFNMPVEKMTNTALKSILDMNLR